MPLHLFLFICLHLFCFVLEKELSRRNLFKKKEKGQAPWAGFPLSPLPHGPAAAQPRQPSSSTTRSAPALLPAR
jgi:hypothetical protein